MKACSCSISLASKFPIEKQNLFKKLPSKGATASGSARANLPSAIAKFLATPLCNYWRSGKLVSRKGKITF